MSPTCLKTVVLVQALETSPDGKVPVGASEEATRHALGNDPAMGERFFRDRAARLQATLSESRPEVRDVPLAAFHWVPITTVLLVGALVAGWTADRLGGVAEINLLSIPLGLTLAWNFGNYLIVEPWKVLRFFRSRPALPRAPNSARGFPWLFRKIQAVWDRLRHGQEGPPPPPWQRKFREDWDTLMARPRRAAAHALLHVAAAAFAAGMIGSMYASGFSFEYRAVWESTFLDAPGVQRLVEFLLGPASALTGVALPDVAPLQRSLGVGGGQDWLEGLKERVDRRNWLEAWKKAIEDGLRKSAEKLKPAIPPERRNLVTDEDELKRGIEELDEADLPRTKRLILLFEVAIFSPYHPLEKAGKPLDPLAHETERWDKTRKMVRWFAADVAADISAVERTVGAYGTALREIPQDDLLKWLVKLVPVLIAAVVIALTAGAAAPLIGGTIGGFLGLTGAAGTSAGLAFLGGGALAAGGLGMAGGTMVLIGGGALLGAGLGGGVSAKIAEWTKDDPTLLVQQLAKLEAINKGIFADLPDAAELKDQVRRELHDLHAAIERGGGPPTSLQCIGRALERLKD